ncbi:MAG: DUF4960 domain-containing protein [Paludibacteraceae bacterium]|nr:DUF4960 domain-containing protein [Paludibacteraceae bacterium]
MRKLFFLVALCLATMVNAKVAFLVPADNTNRDALRYEEVDGAEQSPERRAYDWFNTNYVEAGNGQFICFNDLSNIPTDINAIWIYVDRINFTKTGDDSFDALFADYIDELQAFVNAGGNVFLAKQATRLEMSLVGATNGQSSEAGTGDVIEPDFGNGGYRAADTWGMSIKFFDADGSNEGHRMFSTIPHIIDRDGYRYAELIWSNGKQITDNNCGISLYNMGMYYYEGEELKTNVNDRDHLIAFQTRNNCKVLAGWANGTGCHYGGLIEFYPTDTRKGTVITMGLAAYSWINNNAGWGFEDTEAFTKSLLEYLNTPKPTLAWNNETVPESGVIGSEHYMTATTNDSHYTITYSADDATIANIGSGDGNIYYNYFGTATFKASVSGDGWTTPKSDVVTINSAEIPVTGGDQAVKFAYVLPYSLHTMSNYDNEEGLRPDFEAANWFREQFIVGEVGGQHGCFIRPSDLASLNSAVKVLWIHNDHVGKESADYYNDLGGDTFRDNLAAFVNAGGNVFVSKQATRLVGDLGRNDYPQYQNGGYAERGPWRVGNSWNFENGGAIDHSTHAVYANMGTNTEIMAWGQHTDNNCVWFNFADYGKNDAQRLTQYEADHNCRVLGAWGHDDTDGVNSIIENVGMAEFYPTATGRGTIIAMGLASYHWASPTDAIKILTRDILYYLNIDEVPGFAWVAEPTDGYVNNEQIVQIEDKSSALEWISSNPDIVEIVADPEHENDANYKKLVLKAEGEATITATRSADGYKIPKNVTATTQVTKTITVSKSTPTGVENTNVNAVKATKALRNGQVVIIRDNKTYNVLGAQL